MTPEFVADIMREALMAAFWLALPLLAICFIVGVAMSLIQILTSIQDSAFGTVPRLAAFMVGLIIALPWILSRLMAYATSIIGNVGKYAK